MAQKERQNPLANKVSSVGRYQRVSRQHEMISEPWTSDLAAWQIDSTGVTA